MTAGTDFSASVAWTVEKLGLPGIPYEAALNASDKSRMRECFKKAGLPSPEFFTITEVNSLDSISLPFPLVIKPTDNMGSRGCRRVDSIEEFHEAAKEAIHFSRCGRAIAETFMDGPEYSVDAVVYHGEITICGLADRHIFFPPYFIEMGHTMPAVIETEARQSLLETFCSGIRALGLAGEESIGAAKGDLKLTANGPMIGEIAARLSGGYMSGWTYPYSSGVEPIRAAVLAAMGRKPDGLAPSKTWTSAERAFISIPGTVKAITGQNQAQNQRHVKDVFSRIAEGGKVSFPQNNVTKCGNVIAAAPDRNEAIAAAEAAVRSILIRLDPADPETAAFLSSSAPFPPDAFQLTGALKAALSEIPEGCQPQKPHAEAQRSQRRRGKNRISIFLRELCDLCELCVRKFGIKRRQNPFLNASIYPFPAFTSSGLKDYMGRTVEEALQAVRSLTGFPLPIAEKNAENKIILGQSFWAALIRGSYQGAVYYIENEELEMRSEE
jgi:biotin carboxylase